MDAKKIAKIAEKAADKRVEDRNQERIEAERRYLKDYDRTVMAMGEELDAEMYESVIAQMEGLQVITESHSVIGKKQQI